MAGAGCISLLESYLPQPAPLASSYLCPAHLSIYLLYLQPGQQIHICSDITRILNSPLRTSDLTSTTNQNRRRIPERMTSIARCRLRRGHRTCGWVIGLVVHIYILLSRTHIAVHTQPIYICVRIAGRGGWAEDWPPQRPGKQRLHPLMPTNVHVHPSVHGAGFLTDTSKQHTGHGTQLSI